jgi:hypothetical protein
MRTSLLGVRRNPGGILRVPNRRRYPPALLAWTFAAPTPRRFRPFVYRTWKEVSAVSSTNKRSPGPVGAPRPSDRHAGRAPTVAQLKPAAPPVFRPQQKTVGAQAKMDGPSRPETRPAAPPVYKPQPTPKVLQTKQAVGRQAGQGQRPAPQPMPPSPPRGPAVVQRYCGTPGCNDPNCNDPRNHGFDHVYNLRSGTLYSGSINSYDIKTGTGTSSGTRKYVNSPQTVYPEELSIRHTTTTTGKGGGFSEFINEPLAPGQKADAGHIFGNQYGGFGNQNPSVFPQHPQTNRGNYYNGEPTRHLWRENEDQIRERAEQGNTTQVVVSLREHSRPKFPYCSRCDKVYSFGKTQCPRCKGALT